MARIRITPENIRDLPKKIEHDYVVLERLQGYTVDGVDFSYNDEEEDGKSPDMLELSNCVNCKIINCTFHDRTRKGNFIHIRGPDSRGNIIENCTFKNHTFDDDDNGGEAIILGDNSWSGCMYATIVRKCEFINCSSRDPEIVSIKSADNIIENNCFRSSCKGNLTVRHGGRAIIRNNVFEGSLGGIRILGCGNKIIANYHKDNNNDSVKRRPLIIQNGDDERDPHFNDSCEPSGQEGSGGAYAQAKHNEIIDNIYENCGGPRACVSWGWKQGDDHTFEPERNTFKNNILIADKTDSKFLEFLNEGSDNTFEDNKMYGDGAEAGDLPESSVKQLSERPHITIPDTPCGAS